MTFLPARRQRRDEHDLEHLVRRIRAGEPEAWTTIYEDAYPKLYAYARRRLPNAEAADDAVSETITRAVASIRRYRGDGAGFQAWLYGIVRHVVVDTQRAGGRLVPDATPDIADNALDPADYLVRNEDAQHVREAFARLSPAEQEILELRVVAGLRADEVARIVGRRTGAVRMAQARALTRLRTLLDERSQRAG